MDRNEILAKARKEGGKEDLPDREAQRSGAFFGYTVGVALLLLVDAVNALVLGNVNRGADFALFSMVCVMFFTKYRRLKKRHELIVAIIWGALALAMLVLWILQLAKIL